MFALLTSLNEQEIILDLPSCLSGYTLAENENNCVKCHSTCKTCNGIYEYNCIDTCEAGFVGIEGRCEPCHSSCKSCNGINKDDCLECSLGKVK